VARTTSDVYAIPSVAVKTSEMVSELRRWPKKILLFKAFMAVGACRWVIWLQSGLLVCVTVDRQACCIYPTVLVHGPIMRLIVVRLIGIISSGFK
jgi:hypothetical protein